MASEWTDVELAVKALRHMERVCLFKSDHYRSEPRCLR